jgi:predicted metal-dependent enzyme (double-stranded beta helix superfamily)
MSALSVPFSDLPVAADNPSDSDLHRSSVAGAAAFLRRILADPSTWRDRVRFGSSDERWFERLDVDSAYEVWLISWLPGQGTGLHDHGEALGAFAVAEGTLTETAVQTGPRLPSDPRLASGSVVQTLRRQFGPGLVRGFDYEHIHEVANLDRSPAVSLHAYAPELTAMTQYVLEDRRLRVVASERLGVDW